MQEEISKLQVGDIVKFYPLADEIYYYSVPKEGSKGIVKLLSYNVGLMQMMGIMVEMCLVEFENKQEVMVYCDDLKIIKKSLGEDFQEELRNRTLEHIN